MGIYDRFKIPELQHENPKIRKKAVKEINNERILSYITLNDSNYDVALAAVQRINNELALLNIVRSASNFDIRLASIELITDEKLLYNIVLSNTDLNVRLEAIKHINDNEMLFKIAYYSSDIRISLATFENLDDAALMRIVESNKDFNVRLAAVRSISDFEILFKIGKKGIFDISDVALNCIPLDEMEKLEAKSRAKEKKLKVERKIDSKKSKSVTKKSKPVTKKSLSFSKVINYKIKCNSCVSWSYVYTKGDKERELWSSGVKSLKEKVIERGLPWDDDKVPEAKPIPNVPSYDKKKYTWSNYNWRVY